MRQVPDASLASAIASMAIGKVPVAVQRFTTGSSHFVFDLQFSAGTSVVVRIGDPSARAAMAGAVYLSELLRPRGVPLPAILAQDVDSEFPWLLLERFPGADLGSVITALTEEMLDGIASRVAHAQAITAKTASEGKYGYAARPEQAAFSEWSQVLFANLARSRQRIGSARLFDVELVDAVEREVNASRRELDKIEATPFLHDTTTKNVIVTSEGAFTGIVDVDDLCFGDPRYPAALTLAALQAYGGPQSYVSSWLRHADYADDRLFRLYVSVLLLDLMATHGHVSNGNESPSMPKVRARMERALDANLKLAQQ